MPPLEISSVINEFESPCDHITWNGKRTLLSQGFQFSKDDFESECQLTDAITRKINFNTQTVPKPKRPGLDDPERSTTTRSQRNFNDDQWKNLRRDKISNDT